MEERADILYVESFRADNTKIGKVIANGMNIAETLAVQVVGRYIRDYSAFIIDKKNGKVLAYMKRTQGYWEITNDLKKYKGQFKAILFVI